MGQVGIAKRPYVDFGKISEFLLEDGTWIQRAAIFTLFRISGEFGFGTVPVGEEIAEVALNGQGRNAKADCQILVQAYVQCESCVPEIMAKLNEEAEKAGGKNDRFLMDTAIIAICSGYVKEAAKVLASVIHRDIMPPERREGAYHLLERALGKGRLLDMVWKEVARAIVEKEKRSGVSQIRNLQELMKPPSSFKKNVPPAQQAAPMRLVRI